MDPQVEAPIDVARLGVEPDGPEHGAGVGLGLEQSWDELGRVLPDGRRVLLEPGHRDVGQVRVLLPPLLLAPFARDLEQLVALGIGDLVHVEEEPEVAGPHAHLGGLHA